MNYFIPDVRLLRPMLLAAWLIAAPAPSLAMTVHNVTFVDTLQAEETTLVLKNVALLRYMIFIKAYVAALYLPEEAAPATVLDDVAKRLEICYLVAIKGSDIARGAEKVLARNRTPAQLARLRKRIDRLHAVYRDVKPWDRYALTYLPGKGTELTLNENPQTLIEGADFAQAYFGIWLGKEPIDEKLKTDLLQKR